MPFRVRCDCDEVTGRDSDLTIPAGEQTVPHNHVADGAEDAYAIVQGTGVVVVDTST
jgi:hypothetical protein